MENELARQKVEELVDKFMELESNSRDYIDYKQAKQCALICVDEILQIGWNLPHYKNQTGEEFWNEVKKQINTM